MDKINESQTKNLSKIERIAKENPDLYYNDIVEILSGLTDYKLGDIKKYEKNHTFGKGW
jgi:hypothetical protein